MSERSEALRRLHRLAAPAPAPGAELAGAELDHARLVGATYSPGELVLDPVTGEEARVVQSRFLVVPVAPA